MLSQLPKSVRQYLIVTGNYWSFTLTDGALRMLVVLYFYQLGYGALDIALLFLFYEFFGVITNLFGGWLGAKWGLNRTMNIGLAMQVVALSMLLLPTSFLTIPWVMAAQALSGIAKDLNKMSAKSAIKTLVPKNASGTLYKWVALLTGSKNALKGVGFFLGGFLLSTIGFHKAILAMAIALAIVWLASLYLLREDLGKAKNKPKFSQMFSKSAEINILSAARLFLFGARDVWFVIAVPVYLSSQFDWDHWRVGSFLALWVIGYGVVQSLAPQITGKKKQQTPSGKQARFWAMLLSAIPAAIAIGLQNFDHTLWILLSGLIIFGVVFAINSSLHSYLIVHYASEDGVSLDVGFYYMANAMGRLIGTILSGWIYQNFGLIACLWVSCGFLILTSVISFWLPQKITNAESTN
ncbi:Predicted arabinose efflux permease, MFS family [Marinomonas polaris DSM 16579]|uniref:Predicted arabinose efflux permease, MFS family n=1 Tax=Marinomonas polaris DSM 16579 TaxID=1122206 RepID=A0A1M5JUZ5_9GAMM|nr:organoarsenical effux MFS transporter ArsJ [Marinomonas polaris]SHG44432.1 Predicted arabinose efflux permease, MFS family [Marinomonas polaris DSM 16579]